MSRLDQLMELLADDPEDPELPYMIAQEHAGQEAHEEAITWYERCLAIAPDHAYAYYHKARALEALGRITAAREVLAEGLVAANRSRDGHAAAEIQEFLGELGEG